MNRKFQKLVCFVMAFAILIGLTAGCSLKNNGAENELKRVGLNNKELKEETITLLFPGDQKAEAPKVFEEIEKTAKDSLKIKLDFRWISISQADYPTDIQKRLSAGEKFDAFYYDSVWGSMGLDFVKLARENKLMDISGLLPKCAPKLYKMYSREELKSATIGGKLVALPNLNPKGHFNYAVVREDLMKKYKIPEIKSYKDYEFFLKTVSEKEQGIAPVFLADNPLDLFAGNYGYAVVEYSTGLLYKWDDPAMKITAIDRTPEFPDFVKMLTGWVRKSYVLEDSRLEINSSNEPQAIEKLLSGEAASMIGGLGTAEQMNDMKKLPRPNNSEKYEFKAYLLNPGVKAQRVNPTDGCMVFNANSGSPERTLMFMQWVQENQKNYDLFLYGIKGEHYSLSNRTCPKGIYTDKSDFYLGWSGQSAFENLKFSRFIGSNSYFSDKQKEMYEKTMKKGSEYTPDIGFYPDFSPVAAEVQTRVQYLRETLYPQLLNSNFSLDQIDSEARKIADSSTDSIALEIQNQLDKYNATNGK